MDDDGLQESCTGCITNGKVAPMSRSLTAGMGNHVWYTMSVLGGTSLRMLWDHVSCTSGVLSRLTKNCCGPPKSLQTVLNADVYLLVGTQIDKVYAQQRMTAGSSITFGS